MKNKQQHRRFHFIHTYKHVFRLSNKFSIFDAIRSRCRSAQKRKKLLDIRIASFLLFSVYCLTLVLRQKAHYWESYSKCYTIEVNSFLFVYVCVFTNTRFREQMFCFEFIWKKITTSSFHHFLHAMAILYIFSLTLLQVW